MCSNDYVQYCKWPDEIRTHRGIPVVLALATKNQIIEYLYLQSVGLLYISKSRLDKNTADVRNLKYSLILLNGGKV